MLEEVYLCQWKVVSDTVRNTDSMGTKYENTGGKISHIEMLLTKTSW